MLLTVREAAVLLRTSERQVYRWVDEEELLFQRVRGQLRFNPTDLLEWATSRQLPVSLEAFSAGVDAEERAPSLAQALEVGGTHAGVAGETREEVLRAAIERTPWPCSIDREFVIDVLLAREASGSTAIGDGIAMPLVRQPIVAPGDPARVSVSYLENAVLFGAPDGKPVSTVILLVSPTIRKHMQLLVRLARALQTPEFRAALVQRASLPELVALAARIESVPSVPPPPPSTNALFT
jgi:PTS system nitrogen regulatory IIA component